MSSFYPETYRLDVQREKTEFFSKYKGGLMCGCSFSSKVGWSRTSHEMGMGRGCVHERVCA